VNELDYSTPVCVAVQIALTHLLRSWDIVPTAVTSHSSGEIAAAYAAGALDLPSAMAIVFARGGLASDMNRQLARKGGMVAVGLGVENSKKYLSAVTNGQVVVACENSPSSITVSGDVPGLDQLEAALKRDNIFARRLKVDAAWHSHHMDAVADAYYASMDKKVRPAQDRLDFIFSSPSTGVRMDSVVEIGNPAHWVNSLTGPVKFVDAFRNMCFDDSGSGEPTVDMVIEVGPHAALSGPIQDIMMLPEFKGINIPYASCLVRKQSAVATMQGLVTTLFQKGYSVNLAPVNFPLGIYGVKVLHDLPRYPWNHQTRHWVEPRANRAHRQRIDSYHDLLGSLVPGANMETPTWRHVIRLNDLPWVRDHVVQNNIVYPAAGFVAMALEGMAFLSSRKHAGREIVGYELRDVDILNALLVPETSEGIEVQLQLRPCNKKDISTLGWTEFQVQSVTAESKWTDHCKGIISIQYAAIDDNAHSMSKESQHKLDQPMSESDYRVHINAQDVYADLRAGGICHGPIFRNIKSIHARNKQSVVTFSVVDTAAVMPKGYQHQHIIHPTTLDSVFQAVYTALPGAGSKPHISRVPRSISKLWVAHNVATEPNQSFKAYVDLGHIDPQSTTTSLTVVDASAADDILRPVVTIDGFVYQSIGNAPAKTTDPWIKEKFATVKWAPDVTFLKEAFLRKQLGSELSAEEARMLMDLRQACLFFIFDALHELTAVDLQKLEWYHKKFYMWMRLQVELARTNELSPTSSEWATVTSKEKAEILDRVRTDSTNGEMVCKLGPHIPAILRGEVTALELMLEKSLLSRYYLDGLKWGRANEKLGEMVRHFAHKHPRAKMIEIGGGTGGATRHILNALGTESPAAASYDFTDVSSGFFEAAKEKFHNWQDLVRYKKLDIEQDPSKQGFEEGTYDVVVACQVLHATKCMKTTMTHVRKLLKPGGKLFIMETTQDQLDVQFVFGFLPGWWLSK
jgi:acyl transferase domain-containing protein